MRSIHWSLLVSWALHGALAAVVWTQVTTPDTLAIPILELAGPGESATAEAPGSSPAPAAPPSRRSGRDDVARPTRAEPSPPLPRREPAVRPSPPAAVPTPAAPPPRPEPVPAPAPPAAATPAVPPAPPVSMSEPIPETSPVAEAPSASAVTAPPAPTRSDEATGPASAAAGGGAATGGGAASGSGAPAGSGVAAARGGGGSSGAGSEGAGALSPPRALAAAPPHYPDTARRSGAQGETLLRVHVRADGSVGQVLLDRSSGHPDLDAAASDAVRQWRFDPARRGPRPVDVWILLPVRFTLG